MCLGTRFYFPNWLYPGVAGGYLGVVGGYLGGVVGGYLGGVVGGYLGGVVGGYLGGAVGGYLDVVVGFGGCLQLVEGNGSPSHCLHHQVSFQTFCTSVFFTFFFPFL